MADYNEVEKVAHLGYWQRDDYPDMETVGPVDYHLKWVDYLDRINNELDEKAEQESLLVEAVTPRFPHILVSDSRMLNIVATVLKEFQQASSNNSQFASAHEGFAILWEEVDELWDEVKKNSKTRDIQLMDGEAKQVAAMAIRFMYDITRRDYYSENYQRELDFGSVSYD